MGPSSSPRRFPSFIDALPITRRAFEYAGERHRGQQRKADHAPFILHPLEVAQLLRSRDYPDAVLAAAVLHDVLEDTDAERLDLEERFGERVAVLVAAISEPSTAGGYRERKRRLRDAVEGADAEALAIYAADKIAKARELRIELSRTPGRPPHERLEHYWASLQLLERRLGAHPLVGQLRFELETLDLLPPR